MNHRETFSNKLTVSDCWHTQNTPLAKWHHPARPSVTNLPRKIQTLMMSDISELLTAPLITCKCRSPQACLTLRLLSFSWKNYKFIRVQGKFYPAWTQMMMMMMYQFRRRLMIWICLRVANYTHMLLKMCINYIDEVISRILQCRFSVSQKSCDFLTIKFVHSHECLLIYMCVCERERISIGR